MKESDPTTITYKKHEEAKKVLDEEEIVSIIAAEYVKSDGKNQKSIEQIITKFITKNNITIKIVGDKTIMILPDGKEFEMPIHLGEALIKNGLGRDEDGVRYVTMVEAKVYDRTTILITEEEEKAIKEAGEAINRGLPINLPDITIILRTLQIKLEKANKVKERINNGKNNLSEKEIKYLYHQIRILELRIQELERIIKEYEKQQTKPTPTKTPKEIEEEAKKRIDEETKKRNKRLGLFALIGALAIPSCTAVITKTAEITPEETTIEETKDDIEGETEEEKEKYTEEETEEETNEETEEVTKENEEESLKEIYNYYYSEIERIRAGEISKQEEDGRRGKVYDDGLEGKETEPYSVTQESIVKPGVDYIDELNEFEKKYKDANPEQLPQMIEEGEKLLKKYKEKIEKTKKEVSGHNESTEKMIEIGLRGDTYQEQGVITQTQEEDLAKDIEDVSKAISKFESFDKQKFEKLQQGIKSGKYKLKVHRDQYGDDSAIFISVFDTEKGIQTFVSVSELLTKHADVLNEKYVIIETQEEVQTTSVGGRGR